MPDEVAGRATLLLLGGIVAGVGLGFLVSGLWEKARGPATSSLAGIAAGLTVFAAAMTWVSLDLYGVVRQRSHHMLVSGTLLSFDSVKLSQSMSGRVRWGSAPIVEYTAPDGQVHLARGLGGSLQRREPGTALNVLVDPSNPASAVIADFQNQHAAWALFAGMAGLAWLGTLLTLCQAAGQPPQPGPGLFAPNLGYATGKRARSALRRHAQQLSRATQAAAAAPPPSRFDTWRSAESGQHWQRTFKRTGWVTAVLSVLSVWPLADAVHLGRAVAIALAGLATALICAAVAALLRPGAHVGLTLLAHSIGVLAAGLSAGFIWALTTY